VAPEFGRTDDLAGFVERHEPVLLAAHADGFDLRSAGFRRLERLPDGSGGGVPPGARMLLLRAGRKVGNQIVSLRSRGDDLAVLRVHNEHLGGLRAAINAEQECAHKIFLNEWPSEWRSRFKLSNRN